MSGEEAKKNLYDVATKGDRERFKELVGEDKYLIDEVSFSRSRNVLHIATMSKQEDVVEEVLTMNAKLARVLDSEKSSPLHIAAEQGSLGIVNKLLEVAPEICWWRDCHDMNPIHIAAVKGHVEVLKVLLEKNLHAAMERLHRGQTVLHLCVKHDQQKALEVLVEKLDHLLNAKDDDGETILHLAVRCYQLKIVRYLVVNKRVKPVSPNLMHKTPLDVLNEITVRKGYSEMYKILRYHSRGITPKPIFDIAIRKTEQIIVVMVLIATMAFQATINPPGGMWQEDTSSHKAGDAVMASTHPNIYNMFIGANTTAFTSSLIAIFFLTFEMGLKLPVLVVSSCLLVGVSLASTAVSYGASTIVITPNMEGKSLNKTIIIVSLACLVLGIGLLFKMVIVMTNLYQRRRRREQLEATAVVV